MREQPSVSALMVALVVIAMGQLGSPLLPPGDILAYQIALLQAVELEWKNGLLLLWLLTNGVFGVCMSRIVYLLVNLLLGKNVMECVAFRKSFMEQQVRRFLHGNPTNSQVLVLGEGYDTMALRLAKKFTVTTFWTLDHPATANFKNKVWQHEEGEDSASSSPHLIANLYHANVDLSRKNDLVEVLSEQTRYNLKAPTIAILEGVTMFLTPQQMEALLEDVEQAMPPGSILCFDMLETKAGSHLPNLGWTTPIIDLYLKFKGEPWKLGIDEARLMKFVKGSKTWSLAGDVERLGPATYAAIQLE